MAVVCLERWTPIIHWHFFPSLNSANCHFPLGPKIQMLSNSFYCKYWPSWWKLFSFSAENEFCCMFNDRKEISWAGSKGLKLLWKKSVKASKFLPGRIQFKQKFSTQLLFDWKDRLLKILLSWNQCYARKIKDHSLKQRPERSSIDFDQLELLNDSEPCSSLVRNQTSVTYF